MGIDPRNIKKIAIMGDAAVGKTTLATQYLGSGFVQQYIPTLGANFATKVFKDEEREVRITIIDMAGQKNFRQLRERYFIGSVGLFLVFDVTRPYDAEDQIKSWVEELLEYTQKQGLPVAILANKIDLDKLRQINTNEGIKAVEHVKSSVQGNFPVKYFETSAKDGSGVEEAFNWLIKKVLEFEKEK